MRHVIKCDVLMVSSVPGRSMRDSSIESAELIIHIHVFTFIVNDARLTQLPKTNENVIFSVSELVSAGTNIACHIHLLNVLKFIKKENARPALIATRCDFLLPFIISRI